MDLDLEFVRRQFPAFSEPSLADQSFFENAGGSFACRQVIDRLTRFYTQRKVQPYAPYAASQAAGAEMDEARARLAALLNTPVQTLSFGPSTTQNTYVLAQAFRGLLSAGDAIVVTNQAHEANSGAWRKLADAGIELREWRIDPETGQLDPAQLAPLLDDRTRLVCCPHCSNIVGDINPIAEIADMVHAAGAWLCVDGVSYAPHGLPDVAALNADIYLFSTYKTYGCHQGIMVIRDDLSALLPNQGHAFNAAYPDKRLTPAGPDHAQIAASAGIADYLDALAEHHGITGDAATRARGVHDLMRAHEIRIMAPLLDHLSERNDMRLIGPTTAAARAPTIAVELAEVAGEDAAKALAVKGIMTGGGDFYAPRALKALGIDPGKGVLRLSFVHYTSPEDIDRLIAALKSL